MTILVAVLLAQGVLLGMGALVVDVGRIYSEREQLQSGADAAAYAAAKDCAAGSCATAAGVTNALARARTYAGTNAKDGLTDVTLLCGHWDALNTACPAVTQKLSSCLRDPAPGETYVEVQVRSQTQSGYMLPPTFAGALVGGNHNGTTVTACAMVTASIVSSPTALWANSGASGALQISSAFIDISGLVHSNSSVEISGASITLDPGTEYVTSLSVSGASVSVPSPHTVTATTETGTVDIAAYRPGGSMAVALGSHYFAVPASSCVAGVWSVTGASISVVPAGVTALYVPCGVAVSGASITVNAMLVAEGVVAVSGAGASVGTGSGGPAIVTASTADPAVQISGSSIHVRGAIEAPAGGVTLNGAYGSYQCGVVGDTIQLAGADTNVTADATCAGATTTTFSMTG